MARANAAASFAFAKDANDGGRPHGGLARLEPALQLAVPLLILVFLGVLALSALLQASRCWILQGCLQARWRRYFWRAMEQTSYALTPCIGTNPALRQK